MTIEVVKDELEYRNQLSVAIERFKRQLPYKHAPYDSRSWGHKLHSLCSYQGKLKPAIAHWLVQEFTQPGDLVIDPLCGVGTIPFEAALLGRRGIGNDLSPFASTIAQAKLSPPSEVEALAGLEKIEQAMSCVKLSGSDYTAAEFGLNASVRDYYHPDTLSEILQARKVFLSREFSDQPSMFVWASLLHVLHGNRPYALSRTSHPITPFSPKGPSEYKSVVEKTRARIRLALAADLPSSFIAGQGIEGNYRDLKSRLPAGEAKAIITSPPFLGMRFDRPNWLRMWFCGWSARDFHTTSLNFLERQQTKSLDPYISFFEVSHGLLQEGGLLIMHIGSSKNDRLVDGIRGLAGPQFELAGEVVEDVAALEQHGLTDKGRRTTAHHLLFFRRV
ncbi:DNA methyltransferase [Nocardia farcinica]|uniref:DNA methyltransferase n=1 Tax=Nocardia farcinica TaxID=37329 RepID=UPI001895C6B2|nr:DNA methyltransferase [Nocardia farcinica]MBF6271649.1 SAM-dependent methyltransferase [Nocardia farcinica]MCZ9330396.1 DNA methyltransferase [Nocardia farcinica]